MASSRGSRKDRAVPIPGEHGKMIVCRPQCGACLAIASSARSSTALQFSATCRMLGGSIENDGHVGHCGSSDEERGDRPAAVMNSAPAGDSRSTAATPSPPGLLPHQAQSRTHSCGSLHRGTNHSWAISQMIATGRHSAAAISSTARSAPATTESSTNPSNMAESSTHDRHLTPGTLSGSHIEETIVNTTGAESSGPQSRVLPLPMRRCRRCSWEISARSAEHLMS